LCASNRRESLAAPPKVVLRVGEEEVGVRGRPGRAGKRKRAGHAGRRAQGGGKHSPADRVAVIPRAAAALLVSVPGRFPGRRRRRWVRLRHRRRYFRWPDRQDAGRRPTKPRGRPTDEGCAGTTTAQPGEKQTGPTGACAAVSLNRASRVEEGSRSGQPCCRCCDETGDLRLRVEAKPGSRPGLTLKPSVLVRENE